MNVIDWQDFHAIEIAARYLRDFLETSRETEARGE